MKNIPKHQIVTGSLKFNKLYGKLLNKKESQRINCSLNFIWKLTKRPNNKFYLSLIPHLDIKV